MFILVAFNRVWKQSDMKCNLHKWWEKIVSLMSREQMSSHLPFPNSFSVNLPEYYLIAPPFPCKHTLFAICVGNLVRSWRSSNITFAYNLSYPVLRSCVRVLMPLKYATQRMKEIHECHRSDKTSLLCWTWERTDV